MLDDFCEIVTGEGQVWVLDAPSFLSTLLEWVVTSYLRAFDEVEKRRTLPPHRELLGALSHSEFDPISTE